MSEKNLELYNQVRSVPREAKKPITGGRMNGKTSIEPMWRIKTLTEQFGPCGLGWYYVPVRKWTETVGEEIAVFVDIELYVKFKDEWSKPIHGTGGDMLASRERTNGVYVSDECYKKATTDAISVACKQLGIGADVYWGADYADKDSRAYTEPDAASPPAPPVQHANVNHAEKSNEQALEAKYVNSLVKELKRTGVGAAPLLRNYGKKDIRELCFEEYKDAMNTLRSKPDRPDKPLDPRFIPPDDKGDPNSPWNSRREKPREERKVAPVQEAGSRGNSCASAYPAGNPLPPDLAAEGYSYCGSFGGN